MSPPQFMERGTDLYSATYQSVDSRQRVIGIVQGVRQLVDAIVGLAIAVETDADRGAVDKAQVGGQFHTPWRNNIVITNWEQSTHRKM